MSTSDENCSRVKLEDGRQLYFSIKENKDSPISGWSIILTDGNKVWNTEVSENDVKDMAVGSSYSAEQFVGLFEMAFKLKKADPHTILKYTLTALSAGRDCFFWSIYLPKDSQTFRLGSLNISPLSETERVPVYCRMFDSLLSVSDECRRQTEISRTESEEQQTVSKLALQKLDKLVTVQETAEKVLYTNFVAVLNEKKRKIRELQDQCEALKNALDKEGSSVEDTVSTSKAVEDTVSTSKAVEDTVSASKAAMPTAAKRGRGRGAKTSSKPVSACTALKKRRTNRKGVDFDSQESTDVEEQSAEIRTEAKHNTRVLESSDDDATDIDEPVNESVQATAYTMGEFIEDSNRFELFQFANIVAPVGISERSATDSSTRETEQKSTDTGKPSAIAENILDKIPTEPEKLPASIIKLETTCTSSSTENKPSLPVTQRTACDELDDLLGQSPTISRASKRSPAKRAQLTKKSEPPPAKSQTKRPSRKSTRAANNDSLMDDLLGDM